MRRKLLYFLGFAALAAASYVVIGSDFDRGLFLESLGNVRPLWIAASILLTFASYVLRAVRWRLLLISLKEIDLSSLMAATLLGFTAIYAAGRAGEVVRPIWLSRQEEIPLTGSVGSIVVERVFDMWMILVLLLVGLTTSPMPEGTEQVAELLSRAGWVLLVILMAAVVALTVSHRYVAEIARRIPLLRLRKLFESFVRGIGSLSDPKMMAVAAGHTLLVWVSVALQFWTMLIGLNLEFRLGQMFLIMTVTALGSLAQLPGIGGGLQAAFVFTTTTFLETPTEVAVAAALLAWLATYVPTISAGGIYIMWKGISTRDLVSETAGDREAGEGG